MDKINKIKIKINYNVNKQQKYKKWILNQLSSKIFNKQINKKSKII